jgi:acetyltransferase-like isoleucine patch superfamily enzyme
MEREIDRSARVVDSEIGASTLREFVTVHDSTVGDDCGIYERVSIKKSHIGDSVDINAGSFVENAEIGDRVQVAPNANVVGVTHTLGSDGMELRNDVFERVVLHEGAFVGAGAVVAPGVEVGRNTVVGAGAVVTDDVGAERVVVGSPPAQRITDLEDWL